MLGLLFNHRAFILKIGLLMLTMMAHGLVHAAHEQPIVSITDGWVRETHPGQTVGAAYMTLSSQEALHLVAVKSSSAPRVEIHHMQIEQGVMKMRMLDTLALPAGQKVSLAPGGLHIMLLDLNAPLVAGQTIPLTLYFKKSVNGKLSQTSFSQELTLRVKSAEAGMQKNSHDHQAGHHEHHHHE